MEKTEELLKKILLNQTVLFKKLCKMEDKMNNRMRSAPYKSYHEELNKEREELSDNIHRDGHVEIL